MTASRNGQDFIRLIPAPSRWVKDKLITLSEATAVAFHVNERGEFKELWQSSGWYSSKVFLSNGGEYLVRLGPWATDQRDHTDLAIAFYHQGQLLREYRVRDLLHNQAAAEESVSHYRWVPQEQASPTGFDGFEQKFHLVMIDKVAYDFEVATGKIIHSEIDTKARSFLEIFAAERKDENTRGTALYAASAFQGEFDAHFTSTKISAPDGHIAGVHFKDPEWTADFTPRTPLAHPTIVEAVFPILEGKRVETSLNAEQIEKALQRALDHPFIAQRFASGQASALRMRITGDRLHWDTAELQDLIRRTKGDKPDTTALREWAYIILDPANPSYFTCYLHVATGELLYEDESTRGLVPVRLDASGQPMAIPQR